MISVNRLSKSYGDATVFKDLSFEIKENECTVFMGASGIGKTTLLQCITGLKKPDFGTVSGLKNKKISYVFQENRLIEGISVFDNILCVAPNKSRAEYFLQRTGLADDKNKKASALSGGMKRRLAIARALSYGGDFFYLDEPLRELDSNTEMAVLELIKEEITGKTAVLISHDTAHAGFLSQHRIEFFGTPMQIKGRY